MYKNTTKQRLKFSWEIIGTSMLIANAIFFVAVMGIGHVTHQGVYVFEENTIIRISEIIAGCISIIYGVWLIDRFASRFQNERVNRHHRLAKSHAVVTESKSVHY